MQEKSGAGAMADIIGGKKPTVQSEFIQFDKFSALVIDDIGAMRHALRSENCEIIAVFRKLRKFDGGAL